MSALTNSTSTIGINLCKKMVGVKNVPHYLLLPPNLSLTNPNVIYPIQSNPICTNHSFAQQFIQSFIKNNPKTNKRSPQVSNRATLVTPVPNSTETLSDKTDSAANNANTVTTIDIRETIRTRLEAYIATSKTLDFTVRPRPDIRSSGTTSSPIAIRDGKRVNQCMKWNMMVVLSSFGFGYMSRKERNTVAAAVALTKSYLGGYRSSPSAHTVMNWFHDYTKARNCSGCTIDTFFSSNAGKGRIKYVSMIEQKFPRYLHSLYRYATATLGVDANPRLIISLMNSKSRMDNPFCPVRSRLNMSRKHFWTFFHYHGGKLKNPVTKPTLQQAHKDDRLAFSKKYLKKAMVHDKDVDEKSPKFWRCFLDEKWIYTTSRRKKLKILPPAEWEDKNEVEVTFPKICNRRFPCKVMYMGVIAPPEPRYRFEGKIMLKRISREKIQKSNSFHSRITDSYVTNKLIKDGQWKSILDGLDDITVSDLVNCMQDQYKFDNDIASRIVFNY